MTSRIIRALLVATALTVVAAQGVGAASVIHLDGHFTQHFGGRNGDGPAPCANDELICGTGRVEGYGRATDAFTDVDGEFRYTITLPDGTSVIARLEFASFVNPGRSGEAAGTGVSFGNPAVITFDAVVVEATGAWDGASGGGTITLHNVGNVDQITVDLDLVVP